MRLSRYFIVASLLVLSGGIAPLRSSRAANGPILQDDACYVQHTNGTDVSISKGDTILPASDLVCDQACMAKLGKSGPSELLDPNEALAAKLQNGLDLSALQPDTTTDIYRGAPTTADNQLDEAVPIQNWDLVNYVSDVCSPAGFYRFNIQTQPTAAQPSQTLMVLMHRDLHMYLLRQELLRKLGYNVPPIKYIPHLKVKFADEQVQVGQEKDKDGNPITQRLIDRFLETWIPSYTDGTADRWCGMAETPLKALVAGLGKGVKSPCSPVPDSDTGADPFTIELQDVIVMPTATTYFDLEFGPPVDTIPGTQRLAPETMRTVRSLAVIYGLLNLPESVNQFDWNAARSDDGQIVLHVPDQDNFQTTLDDALWIGRKISQLTRQDFEDIVAHASLPEAVADILVEKLVSRRDNLLTTLGISAPSLAFNPKVSDPPNLVNGKLTLVKWPGYASAFASGDPTSPLRGIQWYLLSEAQANGMEALMDKVNSLLPGYTEQSGFEAHGEEMVQNAVTQYLTTGVTQAIHFGAWVEPIANGSIQVSRDVVFGQYMGTNQIVQLADTFGFSTNIGLVVGFNALPAAVSLSGMAQATLNLSLTHLKPLALMKDSMKQPVQNIVVAWVFKDAADSFAKLAAQQSGEKNLDPTNLNAVNSANSQIGQVINEISKYIGVNESLILTESVTGTQALSAGYGPILAAHHNLWPEIGASAAENEIFISRTHFFRKDQNTLVIFKDSGDMVGPTFTAEVSLGTAVPFPILSLTGTKVSGSAKTRVFQINLDPDAVHNPQIYEMAAAVASTLRTGSTELLESKMKPNEVQISFKDGSSNITFLHWIRRTLKTTGRIQVKYSDGSQGQYLELTDGKQTGTSYQSLATQIGTYVAQRLTTSSNGSNSSGNDVQYQIDTQLNPNPGQTFFGHSQTRDTSYQSQLNKTGTAATDRYVSINYRWEGWNMSAADMQKLVDGFATTYGMKFYDNGFLQTTTDVKMYDVQLIVSLYEAAIQQIMSMSKDSENALAKKYRPAHHCDNYDDGDIQEMSGDDIHVCAQLEDFQSALDSFRKGEKGDQTKLARDALTAISSLEQALSFQDLVALAGGPGEPDQPARVYVTSRITGIFEGNEDNTDPISATHTFGFSDPRIPSGIVTWIENNVFQIDDGEFNMKWLRSVL